MRSSRLVSRIDPVNSRCTSRATCGSSALTSSDTTACCAAGRDWPPGRARFRHWRRLSDTTGLRIVYRVRLPMDRLRYYMYEHPMEYRAVFKCIAGCDGEYDLEQPLYRCPKCGDLLEVAHDLDCPPQPLRRGMEASVRQPVQADRMALWLGRVGEEGMGLPRRPRREHRLDGRRGHQPDVGRALRARARHGRAVDQDVRPVAHRIFQGSRHDGAGLDRAADGCRP